MDFEQLQLIEPIRRALSEQGYTQPTAIQAGAIPPALEGRDVLGSARTGTGKTCAFAVPILQRLTQNPVTGKQGKPPIRALILTPTRELAIQNQEQVERYGKYLPLKSVVIYGGVGQKPQVDAIQAGAGDPHRHARPPGGPVRTGLAGLVPAGDLRAGRGRPDAGHGVHP